MRVQTSIAHTPIGSRTTGGPRLERHREDGDQPGVAAATLKSLCELIVGVCTRAGRMPAAEDLDDVRRTAHTLARRGVSLRDAQRAVHAAVGSGLAGSMDDGRPVDGSGVVDTAVFMMKVLELMGNAVASAYIDQCRLDSASSGNRASHLAELLATDDPDARVTAERSGVDIAAEYDVVALQFADAAATLRSASGDVEKNVLASAEAAVAALGGGALVSLGVLGGTMLIPCVAGSVDVELYVERVSSSLGVDVVAATATGSPGSIAEVLSHCRELVDLARSLDMDPRLYRTGDLALEYQLSRPGPGQSRLRSMIAPLDGYPELLHTLRTFIANEANRRVSAKTLYVHPNTVDYRLKRVEQLTGVDPLSSAGLMSLHAALVVDRLARAADTDVTRRGPVAAAS